MNTLCSVILVCIGGYFGGRCLGEIFIGLYLAVESVCKKIRGKYAR